MEKPSVACTISGAVQFGSTVSNISRSVPGAGAARRGDVVAREFRRAPRRASAACSWAACTIATAIIALNRPGPRMATMTIASSSDGNTSRMSISRMIGDIDHAAGERRGQPEHGAAASATAPPRRARSAATAARRRSGARACRGRHRRCRAGSCPVAAVLPDRRRAGNGRGTARSANAARSRRRTARPATSSTITAEPDARRRGSRRRRARTGAGCPARRGGRWRRPRPRPRCPTSAPDPRIEEAVGQIDAEIDQHDQASRPAACRPAAPDSRAAGCSRPASGRRRARRRSSRSGWRRRAACRPAGRSP